MSRRDAARLRAGIPGLQPLAWLYHGGLVLSRALGLRRRPARAAGARVIAVGNLEAGGGGKTPLAIHLLETAAAAGRRVAYVSRGYRSPAERGPLVTLVTPRGGDFPDGVTGARVLERDGPAHLEEETGDEASLVAERVPRAIIALSGDKRRAVAVAVMLGAELVVVDDAFQSWPLARDVDVVLLDAARPVASGRLLPAGTLRETPASLRRAGVVVFNGAADGAQLAASRDRVARWLAPGAVVLGMRRMVEVSATPGRVFVAAAVARPERVAADLSASGIDVAGSRPFPDHHAYTAADVARIETAARAAGAHTVVVTEKDWVKLRRFAWSLPVTVARLRVEVFGGDVAGWLLPE